MPDRFEPPPDDNEIECARCGARFYYELTRCPNCGVDLYEPEEDDEAGAAAGRPLSQRRKGIGERLDDMIRRITQKPYAVEELFGASVNQADLFDNLLAKVGGDRLMAERLIDFERQEYPQGSRMIWLGNAIQRWERDNRTSRSG